ncbi:MAG: T9SS type A sorting domain-containing protein [Alphaproteobacteria bacterium]|nr:T9SS type A sorting domain-containing protein [Alphaproteobacteria bacterium]
MLNTMNKALFLLTFLLILMPAFCKAQGSLCDSAYFFCQCSSYPGNVSGGNAEPGAYYGCLDIQPNPTWFYLKILNSGSLSITINSDPTLDIDFACWGPFTSPTTPCVEELTSSKIIDCSYSPYPIETCLIPNGITGEYYILLTTKYSNQICDINLAQTGGSGTPDCFPTSIGTKGQRNKGVSLRNFPNPFYNKTNIVFSINCNTKAKLDIFDITGRFVQTLFEDEVIKDKDYSIEYFCKDNAFGIFIYKLTTDDYLVLGKIMHINN